MNERTAGAGPTKHCPPRPSTCPGHSLDRTPVSWHECAASVSLVNSFEEQKDSIDCREVKKQGALVHRRVGHQFAEGIGTVGACVRARERELVFTELS